MSNKAPIKLLLLNDATTTGAGSSSPLHGAAKSHLCEVVVTTDGTLTSITVDLQTTLDGTNWTSIVNDAATPGHTFSANEITNKRALFAVANVPADIIRANITELTESGTTTVDVRYMGIFH